METKEMEVKCAENYLKAAGLCEQDIDRLQGIGYFGAPASSRHHLAFEGGLAIHSVNVVDLLLEFRAFADRRSCYLVGMLHDLVKCQSYEKLDGFWKYKAPAFPGHGSASALIAAELGIELNPVERAAINWHMGSFDIQGSDREAYNAALKKYPRELVLTHAADHLASLMES